MNSERSRSATISSTDSSGSNPLFENRYRLLDGSGQRCDARNEAVAIVDVVQCRRHFAHGFRKPTARHERLTFERHSNLVRGKQRRDALVARTDLPGTGYVRVSCEVIHHLNALAENGA